MNSGKLDQEEKEIVEAFESGKYRSVLAEERKRSLVAAAEKTFKKDKCISIRLTSRDL